ncbi:MAG: hypothetical protein Q9176_003972 [Flavoplaca citrina]
MASIGIKCRRLIEASLLITLSILVFTFFNHGQSSTAVDHGIIQPRTAAPVGALTTGVVKKVAVLFGRSSNANPIQSFHRSEQGNVTIVKRDDTLPLADAIANGKRYLGIIAAAAPKDPIWTQTDFDISGWEDDADYPQTVDPTVAKALSDLKIPTDPAAIQKTSAQQFKMGFENMNCQIVNDDQSGGQYLQTYIPAHGTIITNSVISPQANIYSAFEQMGQPRPTPQELRRMIPRMNRWSDIVWFLWAKKTGQFADDLRYIVKDNIVNKPTRSVIDQVFGIPPNTLELKWPGRTFDVRNSDQGKALLGSPLGSGIAWVVADNKKVLGNRSVKITIFTGEPMGKDTKYFAIFELVRV